MKRVKLSALALGAIAALSWAACHGGGSAAPDAAPAVTPTTSRVATPDEVLACETPTGWRCGDALVRPSLNAAVSGSAAFPGTWSVGAWCVDPSNLSGCASNNNTGVTCSCGANNSGPLLDQWELNNGRWQCLGSPSACPQIPQNTTVTMLSGNPASETRPPIELHPGYYTSSDGGFLGGVTFALVGALTQVTSNVTGVITPYAGADSGLQTPLQITTVGDASALFPHDTLVWDQSTDGGSVDGSYAFVTGAVISSTTLNLSQPMVPGYLSSLGTSFPFTGQINTWKTGDTFSTYSMPQVLFSGIVPTQGQCAQNACITQVEHLNFTQIDIIDQVGNSGDAPFRIGENVQVFESAFQMRPEIVQGSADYAIRSGVYNCANDAGFNGGLTAQHYGSSRLSQYTISAGYIEANRGSGGIDFANVKIFNNTMLQSTFGSALINFQGYNLLGGLEVESNVLNMSGSTFDLKTLGGQIISLTGFTFDNDGLLLWNSGATGAHNTFGNNTFQFLGQTKCNWQTTTSAITTNTTCSLGNFDTDLGATSGCFFFGPASGCNVGP